MIHLLTCDFLCQVTWTLARSQIQPPQPTSPSGLDELDPPSSNSPSPSSPPDPSTSRRRRHSSASPPRRRLRTSDASAEAPKELPSAPPYLLNRNLMTVVQVWREWDIGIGNGPAVKKLNDSYGSGWRAGWPQKERQYYSMRMIIVDHILHLGTHGLEPNYEEVAEQLDRERGHRSVHALAKQIRAVRLKTG